MSDLVLTMYDWVPELPRGLVRGLRVRWAIEEAGLLCRVKSMPFHERGPDHLAAQPFGHPNCGTFVARATARPAFAKAGDDRMAHFAAADAA